jgi:pyoverdine/dityrosine biosynthesis protein Dit1
MIDILGITDDDCWEYGEELRSLIQEERFTTLNFVGPLSILVAGDETVTKDMYLARADACRQDLERRFGSSDEAIERLIKNDRDSNMTYCGMVKFLQAEMETAPELGGLGRAARIRVYKKTAKKMMQRAEAFTLAIRSLRPGHVRLSMHASSGLSKLSIALIPLDGQFQKSPWHSCVALGLDGKYRCVHSSEVRGTHELVYAHGRPFFFREKERLR